MVYIVFEFEFEHGTFRDSITLEDNHPYSEQDIEAMKQQRFKDYLDMIYTPKADLPEVNQENING